MKYKLTCEHYMFNRVLEEGTIVGDGTPYPITEDQVSLFMEGVDTASEAVVKRHQKIFSDRLKNMSSEERTFHEEIRAPKIDMDRDGTKTFSKSPDTSVQLGA